MSHPTSNPRVVPDAEQLERILFEVGRQILEQGLPPGDPLGGFACTSLRLGLSPRACLGWILAFVLLVALWRYWLADSGAVYRRVYFGTDTRADALLLGCAVAFLAHMGRLPRGAWALLLFVFGLLLFGCTVAWASTDTLRVTVIWMGLGGFSISALGAACLIPFLADRTTGGSWLRRAFEAPILVWIGKLSYALYLIHLPVFVFGMRHMERAGLDLEDHEVFAAARVVQIALSFALAALVYHGLEAPVARLRQRLRRV